MSATDKEASGILKTLADPPKFIQGLAFRKIYSNATRMALSLWDIQVTFSQGVSGPDGQVMEDEVCVIMSPQHAKALLNNWQSTIDKYEEIFGSITDVVAIASMASVSRSQEDGADRATKKLPKKRSSSNEL